MMRRRWYKLIGIFLICTGLVGCAGGTVVFAPTPIPPELNPTQYTHPTGAFSVLVPGTWSLYEQENRVFASASFAPPDAERPLVQVQVVNLGEAISADGLGELMARYQTEIRPDISRYTEQERTAIGDGSWRITGLRATPTGDPQPLNTFIQRSAGLLGVIEITVPNDASLRSQVQTIVNTFTMSPSADLPVGTLSILSRAGQSEVEIVNLATWTTPEGVFFVTGEVRNHGASTYADLPVRAILLTDTGTVVADAANTVMGHGIQPDQYAPFSVRFGQGQAPTATQYQVILGSDGGQPRTIDVIGEPQLQWSDETQFTADGDLFVTGTVRNTGDVAVHSLRAVATIFDEGGRVIGAAFADLEVESLARDQSAPFTILVSDLGGTPANYVVNVQGLPR